MGDRKILENEAPLNIRLYSSSSLLPIPEVVGEERSILENEAPLNILLYASSSLLPASLKTSEKLPLLSTPKASLWPSISCSSSMGDLSTGLAELIVLAERNMTSRIPALVARSIMFWVDSRNK